MITDLETVKSFLVINDTANDARIDLLIPRVEADYLSIRGKAFDLDTNGDTVYPEGSDSVASEMIGYLLNKKYGVKIESLADFHQTFEDATLFGYPKSIVGSIKRYLSFK